MESTPNSKPPGMKKPRPPSGTARPPSGPYYGGSLASAKYISGPKDFTKMMPSYIRQQSKEVYNQKMQPKEAWGM